MVTLQVVRYAQSIGKISSTHVFLELSILFFKPSNKIRLATSACPISMWMSYGGETQLNIILVAVLLKIFIIKLGAIVSD